MNSDLSSETIKISVLMISYNQEKYISQAVDSIINQTKLPYEFIISDDCSTDNTWPIILDYKGKYPKLIKAYKNDENIGLYQNYEKIKQYCKGNIVCFLAGDDLYSLSAIEDLYCEVLSNELNSNIEKFIVVTNNYLLYPNGLIRKWNNYKLKDKDPLKSRIRHDFSYRGFGISKSLLDSTISALDIISDYPDIQYGVDTIKGIEEIVNCDKFVFCNKYSVYYRTGVGVTSKPDAHNQQSALRMYDILIDKYENLWDEDDIQYFKFIISSSVYKIKPSFKNFIVSLYYYFKNINNFSHNVNRLQNLKNIIPIVLAQFIRKHIHPIFIKVKSYIS